MARVLIVDWRKDWKRRDQLAAELRTRGHVVSEPADNVVRTDDADGIPVAWTELKPQAEADAQRHDVLILHVGNEQYGWDLALTGPYRDKPVVCYTGLRRPPAKCVVDCQTNPLHCCYPDPIEREMDNAALRAIARFVDQIGGSGGDAAALSKAKSELMGMAVVLEAKLELLYGMLEGTLIEDLRSTAAWRTLKADDQSSAALQAIDERSSLVDVRDRLLPDAPEWAR